MAGFGFSFTDLTSGLASLNDIGERFNKIREDIESTLDKTLGAALPNDPQAEAAHQGMLLARGVFFAVYWYFFTRALLHEMRLLPVDTCPCRC